MHTITMKMKHGSKYIIHQLPPIDKISVNVLNEFIGKDCILEHAEGERKLYAIGNDSMKGKWSQGKVIMSMEDFTTYWQYKMLEYGIDLFTRLENREERIAIMTVEGVPESEAIAYCDSQPNLYGIHPEAAQ